MMNAFKLVGALLIILVLVFVFLIQSYRSERDNACAASREEVLARQKLQRENELLQSRLDQYRKEMMEKNTEIRKKDADLKILQDYYSFHSKNLSKALESNLTSIPWLAGMISDFLTIDIEHEAKKLDWGNNYRRSQKVASIRAIRAEAQRRIEEAKIASYQLAYLKELYPALEEVLDTDFSDLEIAGSIPQQDPVRSWLTEGEWVSLPEDNRNQLALDRYIQSHRKNKWQIGRDYELSVSYEFSQQGFSVDNTGSYLKLDDMGRDIIASKNGRIYIIQCKYWSESKTIHEKHIMQLYGTSVLFSIENPGYRGKVTPVFVTNITLSEKANMVAQALKVKVYENHPFSEFPRIKCNIGRDENGSQTYIYHLPMDDQYDNVKLNKPGECYAFTVKEAVEKGFRRAYRWHGKF